MNKPMLSSQERSVAEIAQHHTVPHMNPGVSTEATHEEIARCAYEIYIKSGRAQGQCARNWDHAEEQLRQEAQANRRTKQAPSEATGGRATAAR